MCKFEENVETMTFENCNLFKRSLTTQGLGYTFNNEQEKNILKDKFRNIEFSPNINRKPSMMRSASLEHSLTIIIEDNAESTKFLENRKKESGLNHRPQKISVSIHSPKEPADTVFKPSTSISIPLGHSTTFLIKPEAREIDESGKQLTELERNCRLDEDTDKLEIYNIYTRTACLFECKIKYATKRCQCTPWNYPLDILKKASLTLH